MVKNKDIVPEMHTMTEMLRGQASKIFDDVSEKTKWLL